ncbi:MAG: hypothetical protein WA843_02905 [Candidatus Saccharimonadales bacterium]
MKEYIKENVGIGELHIYRILSSTVLQNYNKDFSVLVLPYATDIDTEQRTLTLPFYEGKTFNDTWDVSNGGSPMGLDLVEEIPLALRDLAKIDPTHISDDETLTNAPHVTFDHTRASDYFYKLAAKLQDAGSLTGKDLAAIKALLSYEQTTDMIINNGDFYPRNFIKRPDGKVVLIDWETWNDHSPFFIVDHPENIAAVQYVHMWGNSEWQNAYQTELSKHFELSKKSFAKGIVIKALTLASFFPQHKNLFRGQVEMIRAVIEA